MSRFFGKRSGTWREHIGPAQVKLYCSVWQFHGQWSCCSSFVKFTQARSRYYDRPRIGGEGKQSWLAHSKTVGKHKRKIKPPGSCATWRCVVAVIDASAELILIWLGMHLLVARPRLISGGRRTARSQVKWADYQRTVKKSEFLVALWFWNRTGW